MDSFLCLEQIFYTYFIKYLKISLFLCPSNTLPSTPQWNVTPGQSSQTSAESDTFHSVAKYQPHQTSELSRQESLKFSKTDLENPLEDELVSCFSVLKKFHGCTWNLLC